jgi:purine-nucleoside phosphorylase
MLTYTELSSAIVVAQEQDFLFGLGFGCETVNNDHDGHKANGNRYYCNHHHHNKNRNSDRRMDESFLPYRVAAHYLKAELEKAEMALPIVGVICGSGLSGLSKALQGDKTLTVQYADIPGFPAHCTVAGHEGEVVFGLLSGIPTACFRGRFHSYEGHDMKTTALPVTVMRCLSTIKVVLLTNAAGGLNPDFNVGDVVCVTDHLALPQLAGKNPLIGPNDDELGPRFPPTSNAYCEDLREAALKAAKTLGYDTFVRPQGTYAFVSGPMYESKSECRFLRQLGGDCVGMSTIPEVVTAHHSNMKVLCLSLVTNKAVVDGDEGPAASHQEVLEAVAERSEQMQNFVQQILRVLDQDGYLAKIPDLVPITSLQQAFLHYQKKQRHNKLLMGISTESLAWVTIALAAGTILGWSLSTSSNRVRRTA